jgi:2-amino-4-hydroxy-6-hydroxymethyldihydropteridine diphosphokinase
MGNMPRCYISLGGNLGHVSRTFDQALNLLGEAHEASIIAVSAYRETRPVGSTGIFLNAAAEIETSLAAPSLLDRLHAIEHQLGRVRMVRWGPRTVDLDLLFYDSEIIVSPRLTVPHPAAWYRRFVLDALVEIAPRFLHPQKQVDIQTLHDRLLKRPLTVALAGGEAIVQARLKETLSSEFADVRVIGDFRPPQPSAGPLEEPALTVWLGNAGQAGSTAIEFEQLPRLSRIDATKSSEPVDNFVRHVVQSALG